jgi:hypothetical protein
MLYLRKDAILVRTQYFLLIVSLAAASACRPNQPAAVPDPAPSVKSAPAELARANEPESSPVASGPIAPAAADSAVTKLRELAARYLQPDGQGGWRIDESSATELEKLGPQTHSLLLALLQDSAVETRRGAAFYLLGHFDAENRAQAAAFSTLLSDADVTLRGIGLSAVKQMRREDQAAVAGKLAAMLDPAREAKAENRAAIARLLGILKSEDAAVLPALVAAASGDPEAKVRGSCLVAIAQLAAADVAVEQLIQGLSDREATVRLVAATRLRLFGKSAAPAAQTLTAALADSDPAVRDAIAESLISIGAPAVEPLAGMLNSPSADARKYALACLAKIGTPAKAAIPAIEKCRQDADEQIRKLAEAALKQIGMP